MRRPLAAELCRLVDATITDNVRYGCMLSWGSPLQRLRRWHYAHAAPCYFNGSIAGPCSGLPQTCLQSHSPARRPPLLNFSTCRRQIQERSGSAALAARLVPAQPDEAQSAERASLLWDVLTTRAGEAAPMPQLQAGWFGLPGPAEVQQYLQQLRDSAAASAPRLQAILERPGAQELLADVQWGLLQRFAARGIKFAMGVADGGSGSGSGSSGSAIAATSSSGGSGTAAGQGVRPGDAGALLRAQQP